MIRKHGELTAVSWHDAFVYSAKKMASLSARGASTAVSIGQTYCLEDAGAVNNLAKLLGAGIFSYMNRENGLAKVLGYDGSPNTLEEILGCDGIFIFGDSLPRNPVILSKLRLAAGKGIPVTIVTSGSGKYNLPCRVFKTQNSTGFIKQIVKALIDAGAAPKNADGFTELKASLSAISACDDAKKLAESYITTKKAMVLYALSELSAAAAVELANMAVVAGHIGSPRNGIYMLRQMSGSQVLADYGITGLVDVAEGIKGLMVFGEDIACLRRDASRPSMHGESARAAFDRLEFLMVQDTHLTETAKLADVVFPLAVVPEIDGTFVNTERRLQRCNKAIEPPTEYTTAEIAQKIAEVLEGAAHAGSVRDTNLNAGPGKYNPTPVLFVDGFGFPGKRAKLQVIEEDDMVDELVCTCSLVNAVEADLPQPAGGASDRGGIRSPSP